MIFRNVKEGVMPGSECDDKRENSEGRKWLMTRIAARDVARVVSVTRAREHR
jgi:hypothetical protein